MLRPEPTTAPTQPARQAPASPNSLAPTSQPATTIAGVPPAALPALERARSDLAQHLGIAVETIEVLGVRRVYRPTGASDSPGRADGWQILLAVGDTRYTYRVDAQGKLSRTAQRE